ncbi:predicted protein [Pyrenophora tritici-repentis Pt-1C-BFP]|uniref:Uncharacterized protein n=1 Tax=Pyrenophora tritici-repentis (strain Pt-1C-BFP) TaxID=426418 RepID=B2WNW3_PYRTR|nr:uncharacterized protein PTRG_11673 [Pyrenophora tritici-repentis Pt-1C-BFP]EDU44723.1 predicted protein [Pyrenophora tritici-repentis Pt-1C-BFP]
MEEAEHKDALVVAGTEVLAALLAGMMMARVTAGFKGGVKEDKEEREDDIMSV